MKISVKARGTTTSIEADGFDNLLSVLRFYGYEINATCDGLGKCGACKVIANGRLVSACKTIPENGMTVELFENDTADFSVENLSESSASAIIDIGTTTVRCALISDKKILSVISEKNKQSSFGSDIISRISNADGDRLSSMHSAIISQVNSILLKLSGKIDITDVSIVGNTAMLHIFLNIPCNSMGVYPYTPVFLDEKNFESAREIGLDFDIPLYVLPSISAFCGADITADIAEAYTVSDDYTLLIDFGTNAEIALFNKDNIFVTSAAAGPAFEGGNISCGMPALSGAICSYKIDNNVPVINTVDKKNPVGVCGSGLVDIIAELLRNGIIDKTGYLGNDFEICKNIFITQSDIREFQLAKSAVEAAIKILSQKVTAPVKKVCICGNFGKYLNIENAKFLHLIPRGIEKVEVLENAPLSSFYNRELLKTIAENAKYVDISLDKNFENIFESSLNFSE